ncbi:MAG: hypothetical protein RL322_1434, partial [Pseudomonadota bacterium]
MTLSDLSSTPADESAAAVPVEMLLIGANNLDAWVGAGGVGLQMSDVSFGVALLGEQLTQPQIDS